MSLSDIYPSNEGFQKVITSSTTIYVATTGSDTTGNGTSGSPYYSPAKAMAHLNEYIIVGDNLVTIDIANGTYTGLSTVFIQHPQANRISIVGDTATPTNCSLNFSSGQAGFQIQQCSLYSLSGVSVEVVATTALNILNHASANVGNCRFDCNSNQTTGTVIGVYDRSSMSIYNCTVTGGYIGLRVNTSSTVNSQSNMIYSYCYYGVYVDQNADATLGTRPTVNYCIVGVLAYYKSNIWLSDEIAFSNNTTNSSPAASTANTPIYGNVQSYIGKSA